MFAPKGITMNVKNLPIQTCTVCPTLMNSLTSWVTNKTKNKRSLDFDMVELHSWLILYALKPWKKTVFKYKTTLGLASGKRKQVFCLNSSCTVYALRDVQCHQLLSTQRQRCPPHTCSETLGESKVSTNALWERNRGNNYFVKESEELFLKKVSSELCLKG